MNLHTLSLDGRNIRGKGGKSVKLNFAQYGLDCFYLDSMIFDLTRNPFRKEIEFDAIVCDRTLLDEPYWSASSIRRTRGCKEAWKSKGHGPSHHPFRWECCTCVFYFYFLVPDPSDRLTLFSPPLYMNSRTSSTISWIFPHVIYGLMVVSFSGFPLFGIQIISRNFLSMILFGLFQPVSSRSTNVTSHRYW